MAKKTTGAKAASQAKPSSSASKPNASEFIRSQPLTMTTADVIDAGKKAGITMTANLVYMVRTRLRANNGIPPGKRGRPETNWAAAATAAPRATQTSTAKSEEQELARLILNIGFERAESVFKKLKAALG